MKTKLIKLPPGVLFHHDLHLMVFRPQGVITEKRLREVIKTLERVEDSKEKPFNRFSDLSKLEAIEVDFAAMFQFSLHRRLAYAGGLPVRSAVYVTNPEAVRVARIHTILTDYSPLEVKMFQDLGGAAKWLGVSLETLELDPWGALPQDRKPTAMNANRRSGLLTGYRRAEAGNRRGS